jgi:site-specific DNA-cytosine methylase
MIPIEAHTNYYSLLDPNTTPTSGGDVAEGTSTDKMNIAMNPNINPVLDSGIIDAAGDYRCSKRIKSMQTELQVSLTNLRTIDPRIKALSARVATRAYRDYEELGQLCNKDNCTPTPISHNSDQPTNASCPSHAHDKLALHARVACETEGMQDDDIRPESIRKEVREKLSHTRSSHTVERARELFAENVPKLTVLENCTGGCLDTMAAGFAGFRHLGGTEKIKESAIGKAKARIFEDLTLAQCLGEQDDWPRWFKKLAHEVDYLKSGTPCTHYAALGNRKGSKSSSGFLFLSQLLMIGKVKPKVARIEMVPTALEVNNGEEVNLVVSELEQSGYQVHMEILDCQAYGDPSNRSRLFIIAIRNDIAAKVTWRWPDKVFDNETYPIARDISVPDSEVPSEYWLYDEPNPKSIGGTKPKPNRIQHIGKSAADYTGQAGHSDKPANIQGWDGSLATQMPTNGGSRRPSLAWRRGQAIGKTRKTVPVETCRAASLDPDSYMKFARQHFNKKELGLDFPKWVRELVNIGVPICTSLAIDRAVHSLLIEAGVKPSDPIAMPSQVVTFDDGPGAGTCADDLLYYPCSNPRDDEVTTEDGRRAFRAGVRLQGVTFGIGDSGATDHLFDHDEVAGDLHGAKTYRQVYETASEINITTELQGELEVSVLNLDRLANTPDYTSSTITVNTVKGFSSPLWSFEAAFRDQGYDINLTHGYGSSDRSGLYRPNEEAQQETLGKVYGPESFIPIVYDWEGQGGWKVPFVIKRKGESENQHKAKLEAIFDSLIANNAKTVRRNLQSHTYTVAQANKLERRYWAYPAVTSQMTVRSQGERNIRPPIRYGGLKRYKGRKLDQIHRDWAHLGEPHMHCPVCEMYKGVPRPVARHMHGKPREWRAGFAWAMDLIIFKHRSEEGSKYLICLTDLATNFYQLIPLIYKSDATRELRKWILSMRTHPAFHENPHPIIGKITTDNDGAWSIENREFQQMVAEVGGLEIEYGDTIDHARDNAVAEGSNKIIEDGIKSILFDRNLPPSWWQRAANDVMFLANRLPVYSLDGRVPPDGDVAPPIHHMFNGYVSRNQVYRELDYFVVTGTPALCQVKVKGSSLEPRVRWGVAIGQRGKITLWLCPFSKARFRTRTFTAQVLRSGLSYSQFLGLGDIAPSAQSRMMPKDDQEDWTIELPDPRPAQVEAPPPVRELINASEEDGEEGPQVAGVHYDDEQETFQPFPLIRKSKHDDPTRLPIGGDAANNLPKPKPDSVVVNVEAEAKDGDRITVTAPGTGSDILLKTTEPLPTDKTYHQGSHHDLGLNVGSDSDEDLGPVLMSTLKDPKPNKNKARAKNKEPSKPGVKPHKKQKKRERDQATPKPTSSNRPDPSLDLNETVIEIESYGLEPEEDAQLEELTARADRKFSISTNGENSFQWYCKQHDKRDKALPFERHNTYRLWLLTKPERAGEPRVYVEDLPRERTQGRTPLKAGITLPYPGGPHWDRMIEDKAYCKVQQQRISADEEDEEKQMIAYRAYLKSIRSTGEDPLAEACIAAIAGQISLPELDELVNIVDRLGVDKHGAKAFAAKKLKKRRQKVESQAIPDPKNMVDALMSDRGEEWVTSIHKEFNGLMDQGVFSLEWTKADLERAGIVGKPVPCSIALTHKMKDGILEKLKTRICIAGHPGHVTKGIHYHEVFSPSPVQHTERLLQALRVHLHLENLAWDISQAYTWAPLPPGERIAVVMPEGFKSRDSDGNELFAVLEKNLYGMPNAARGWGQHRDEFILSHFNGEGWRCRHTRMDPCLFIIDKWAGLGKGMLNYPILTEGDGKFNERDPNHKVDPEAPTKNWIRSYLLIHTDDVDAYGQSIDVLHEINNIMNNKWKTELVNPEIMLGVKRELTIDPDGHWTIKCSMKAFIDNLYESFKEEIVKERGNRIPVTPFPDNVILTKATAPAEGEVKRNIARGFQRIVGSLLWCVRHTSPKCAYGCSQLCKLMSAPTDLAWSAALMMVAYLKAHSSEGITFRETETEPICFVDASNRDDPVDGKAQYGFVMSWGGPLTWKSSKLNHVGINSTYNEYMAIHHAIKQIVWTRQLMQGMGLQMFCTNPTRIHADNLQANNLCIDDIVTQGNMYFRTGYHYNKEAVEDGYVSIQYCRSEDNVSDSMTKALGSNKIRAVDGLLSGSELLPPKFYV